MKKTYLLILIPFMWIISVMWGFIYGLSYGLKYDDKHTYPHVAVVSEINNSTDTVTVTDCVGYQWTFEGVEDWMLYDTVAMKMYDNGTENTILDDKILQTYYSSFEIK